MTFFGEPRRLGWSKLEASACVAKLPLTVKAGHFALLRRTNDGAMIPTLLAIVKLNAFYNIEVNFTDPRSWTRALALASAWQPRRTDASGCPPVRSW